MIDDVHLKTGLYVVPTPIGNLKDITLRALETLKSVDIIYCEDTRVSHKFLSHYGIQKPLRVYNDHSTEYDRSKMLEAIRQSPIALISDAGMPLISDPGFKLVQKIKEEGLYMTVLPGACAFITALVGSGLENDHFTFFGFFNPKKIESYKNYLSTLIFYESCHSILDTLNHCAEHFPSRRVAVGRELTKLYEEMIVDDALNIIQYYKDHPDKCRGEFVLMLSVDKNAPISTEAIQDALNKAFQHSKGKDAVKFVSEQLNLSKKTVYDAYLQMKSDPLAT